jgi:hypothetical protein
MGLPSRSSAADVHDSSWSGSARNRPDTREWRDRPRQWRAPHGSSAGYRQRYRTPAQISQTRGACLGVTALRNSSRATAASRSLDPFRARREPDRRRPTKNGLCASNKALEAKPRRTTSRTDLPKPPRNVTVAIGNRSSAFLELAPPPSAPAQRLPRLARQHPEQPRRIATARLRPRLIDRGGKPLDNQKPHTSLPPARAGVADQIRPNRQAGSPDGRGRN